jgi:hypothetical protein
MSSKNRSQHFVPRHYLRRFSFDEGQRIRVLTIKNDKYIPEAGLKGQCARDYFYHTDPRIEENLGELEGKAEEYFKRITEQHWLPSDGPARNDLLTILNVMRSRTEMFADQTLRVPETAMREGFRRYLEANNKHELLKFLPDLRFRATHWPTQQVIRGLTSTMLLSDLQIKLLVGPSEVHFVTSDHPVVLLNQAFVNILRNQSVSGLAMRGLQLFLPLSPDLLMLAFDPICYRVGHPGRKVIQINRKEDVELINALQILNANQCVYFRDEVDEPLFRNLLFKFRPKRPNPRDLIETHEVTKGDQKESFIIFHAPTIPLPGIWSFCKTRQQFSHADFGQRDPYTCRLYKEYQEDCRKRSELLPLGKWLEQRHAMPR